MKKIPGLFI